MRQIAPALIAFLASTSGAQAACRLALLLAIDVSSSINETEYALQRDGLAKALVSPDVMSALLGSPNGSVAFAAFEWSGRIQQHTIVDWMLLETPASVQRAAAQIASSPRNFTRYPTSMGHALGYGARMLQKAPLCERQVVDISGDGINNDSFGPRGAYARFGYDGVTVNGLVIEGADPDVEWFYDSEVRRGADSFVQVARGFEDFQRAMTEKLYRETSDTIVGALPAAPASAAPKS